MKFPIVFKLPIAVTLCLFLLQAQALGQVAAANSRLGGSNKAVAGMDLSKASAFRSDCILLNTKFERDGITYPGKTGIGCMILIHRTGHRILAMPASLLEHIQVVPGKDPYTVDCSLLLATKVGNAVKYRDPIGSFAAQFEFPSIPDASSQMRESEKRIYKALNERGEFSFKSQPLTSIMKFMSESFNIPILIDNKALEAEDRTGQEKVSVDLPTISCRSALNLILEPFELTFVVEHEVLTITTKKAAGEFSVNPAKYRDWKKSIERAERVVRRSLFERSEISFERTPLVDALKFFQDNHNIPIAVDKFALMQEDIDLNVPITLELPAASIESALNLILEPLMLTFVVENEVLKITTKKAARAAEVVEAKALGANQTGVLAFGCSNPSGAQGPGIAGGALKDLNYFELSRIANYRTSQGANDVDPSTAKPIQRHVSKDGGNKLQEFVAIKGPIAASIDKKLGVAFLSLPGDFQAIPIPALQTIQATQKKADRQFVFHQDQWLELSERNNYTELQIIEGSPVVDEKGEPVGLFVDNEVVRLFELFIDVITNDPAEWGYWGTEEKPSAVVDMLASPALLSASKVLELPDLITAEIKEQMERVATLKGEEKVVGIQSLRKLLDAQVARRKTMIDEKLKSVQSNLESLNQLSDRLRKEDHENVGKIIGEPLP